MTFKPTPQHQAMQTDGRIARRLITSVAHLHLPDEIELPTDRPGLFAGNHRSLLDVFVTVAAFSKIGLSCRLLVQAAYFSRPGMGHWLRRIGCIPMSSKTSDEAIATAIAALEDGQLVAIMPEGRLVPPEERPSGVGQARPGVSIIAEATGAQIMPVAFHDTDRAWPRGGLPRVRRRRPDVTLRVDPPLDLPGDEHQDNADFVMGTIKGMLDGIDRDALTA